MLLRHAVACSQPQLSSSSGCILNCYRFPLRCIKARWRNGFHQRVLHTAQGAPSTVATAAVASDKTVSDHILQAPKTPDWKWEESDDAVRAYTVLLGILALGNVPLLQQNQLLDLPYFISLAVCTIYIGAHRGVTTKQRQQISIKEGLLAPVFASTALFGCYLLIKFFPDFNLQTFLNGYFWLLGSLAISGAAQPVLRRVTGSFGQPSIKFDVPEGLLIDESSKPITKAELAPSDFLAVALALGATTLELQSGHSIFTLNNLVACIIATEILQLVGLRSFRTAALLMVGLLLYDVFWVFGSPGVVGDNVMLTVATSDMIVGPTRLLFPRVAGGVGEAADFPYSLLGLGDVAIPGLLACLALRYDASRSTDMFARAVAAASALQDTVRMYDPDASTREVAKAAAAAAEQAYDEVADREQQQRDSMVSEGSGDAGAAEQQDRVKVSEAVLYQRVYFTPVMWTYVGGLVMAFAANSITHLGQPALLYIVPCTLAAVAATAATRGEFDRVWQFTDVATFGVPELPTEEEDGK